jgi:hypothetical protein
MGCTKHTAGHKPINIPPLLLLADVNLISSATAAVFIVLTE